jgi:hypothetical protein
LIDNFLINIKITKTHQIPTKLESVLLPKILIMSTEQAITLPHGIIQKDFVRNVLGCLTKTAFDVRKFNGGKIPHWSQRYNHYYLNGALLMLSNYLDYRDLSKINETSNVALFQDIYALACMMHEYDEIINTDYATSSVETALSKLQISNLDREEFEITQLANTIMIQICQLMYNGDFETIPPVGQC